MFGNEREGRQDVEDQDKIRDEEQNDVDAHRRGRKKLMTASEEPTDEARGSDDDVEVHGRRKHRS